MNIICMCSAIICTYRETSNIRRTKYQNLHVSRLVLHLSLSNLLKPGDWVENEDVVGAAPTGDAPTTSEWSIIFFARWGVPYIRGLTVWYYIRCVYVPLVLHSVPVHLLLPLDDDDHGNNDGDDDNDFFHFLWCVLSPAKPDAVHVK